MPRRARHLIPAGLPRRGELIAACAVAILRRAPAARPADPRARPGIRGREQGQQVAAVVAARARRWPGWPGRLPPGPGNALAGFTAGPSSILWHLGGGHLAGRAGAAARGVRRRAGLAAQAVSRRAGRRRRRGRADRLAGLAAHRRVGGPAAAPGPGRGGSPRRRRPARSGRAPWSPGTACALGVVPATGAIAELRWAEALARHARRRCRRAGRDARRAAGGARRAPPPQAGDRPRPRR